jgi:nucleoside-diphosphate-sugar epimerase
MSRKILVTGGAGYVGSALVPKLIARGDFVKVLDLYPWGPSPFAPHERLEEIRGDIRDADTVDRAVAGADAVIHLACISNDPSFELDPELGRSINYDCFPQLVRSAKASGVERFIYASSSSVYGIKDEEDVHEDLSLEPLTDYSRFKALCEEVLLDAREPGFRALVIRPATVCGYSPRLRLDVVVNLLTNHAYHSRRIKVFGGPQRRPNIHIEDVCDIYMLGLDADAAGIDGGVYNAGYENHRVSELAELVRRVVGDDVEIISEPTDDLRSYHISSKRIERELGFAPSHTIEEAVGDLVAAFDAGKVPDAMEAPRYYNIRTMQREFLAGRS